MQTKAPLLLGLSLALGAGLGLVLWLGGGSGDGRRRASEPGRASDAGPGIQGAAAALVEAAARTDEARPERVEALPKPSVAPGKERVRPTGSFAPGLEDELYGRVVNAFGAGVLGAEVVVSAVGETADGLIQVLGGSTDKETTSGPDGSFRVARPSRWEEVEVKVKARGYLPFEESQDLLEADGDQDLGVFELEAGVVLGGRVVDAAGQAVAGADVRRIPSGEAFDFGMRFSRRGVVTTDDEGAFLLPNEEPGEYTLMVAHPDHPEGRFEGQTPPAGSENVGLVLALTRATTLLGRIEGYPAGREHIRVVARPRDPKPEESVGSFEEMLEEAGFGEGALEADARLDGTFEITGAESGKSYSVRGFSRGGFFGRDVCTDEAFALAGAREVLLRWKPGASLAFRVVDEATRGAVSQVKVRFIWESGNDFGNQARVRDFADGNVLIDELRPKADQHSLALRISAPGYLDLERLGVQVSEMDKIDLGTLNLRRAATMRVRVADAEDRPVSGARVRLEAMEDEETDGGPFDNGAPPSTGKTDAEGLCELPALGLPIARLSVTHPSYADYQAEALVMPKQGVREERVRLIEGGGVRILVLDAHGEPIRDVEVRHAYPPGADGPGSHTTNRKGEVRLRNQAPGEHRFRSEEEAPEIGGDGNQEEGWVTVLVADGKETLVHLGVAPRASLQGVVLQAGSPLDRATVSLIGAQEEEGEEVALEFQVNVGSLGFQGSKTSDRTDRQGNYELEGIPSGSYRVSVSHASRALPHILPVRLAPGENELNLDLPLTAVEGRVTDDEGHPLAGIRVRALPAESSAEAETGYQAMRQFFGNSEGPETAADGSYRLVGLPADRALIVEASGEDFIPGHSSEVTLRVNEVKGNVDVRVQRGGVLRVRVAGDLGPFAFLQATHAGEEGTERASSIARIRGGEAVFKGLKPGAWTVQRMGGDGESEAKQVTAEVSAPGETVIDYVP
jgi:protocatechuate 3,4-dioxygenase beta subunit